MDEHGPTSRRRWRSRRGRRHAALAPADAGSPRAAGDGGAALVEFALVMPFLFLILFGIVEFGMATNDYQSMRQAVREGARQAVVADYGSTTSCGLDGSAAGAGANSKAVICTTKERAGLGNDVRVRVVYVAGTDTDGDYGVVKVCATRAAKSITGLLKPFLRNVELHSSSEMRAEKPLSLDATASETDPGGASWSWCTTPS